MVDVKALAAVSDLLEELTEDDVLRIDPVHEYEHRQHLREFSEGRLAAIHDESDELVELGRPTGP